MNMCVELVRAALDDAEQIWQMQIKAFARLLGIYQDIDTNPCCEPIEKVAARLVQPFTYYYLIRAEGETVGAIRVVDKQQEGSNKRISPLFILPEYQGRGYAQHAMREAERIHGSAHWELDTILQEKGNCHLYEKMGYRQTGKTWHISDRMTLVLYEKCGRMMIIWLLCVWGCALVFDAIGIYAMKRKEPMWFWSGSTVKQEEIADIPAYNRANGWMWIGYSLPYWIAGVLGIYGLAAGAVVLFVGAVGGSLALVAAYNRIYRKYSTEGSESEPSFHETQ